MDIDLALLKINPDLYYRHDGTYEGLEMLDNHPKPSFVDIEAAWMAWLNSEGKAEALRQLEAKAEAERLKHITAGDGKAMAYQQQRAEVLRFEQGEIDLTKFPVAGQMSEKLGVPVANILTLWQQSINAWLITGGKIEANLAKAKADLSSLYFDNLQALDDFVAGVNFYL